MDNIKRVWIIPVVFIHGLIKITGQDGIHTNGIGSHILDHTEPSHIRFLINGILRGKMSRDSGAQIHALDLKGFHPLFPHLPGFPFPSPT